MAAELSSVTRVLPGIATSVESVVRPEQPAEGGNFSELVENLLASVNDAQKAAGMAQDSFLNGESVDLHQVMIKAEEAGIAMDLLLEIRNRLLSGYNELIRMPM